jgi:BTB/POZ domain
MNIVRPVAATFSAESMVPHMTFGFQTLQALRSSEDTCDYTMIVDGKSYHVHLVIMAIFSGYFLTLMSRQSQWKESRERISNFGGQSRPEPSTATSGTTPEPYATPASVQAVIDWIYKGDLGLDDRTLTDTDDSVYERLDHYMEILKLADRWDITLLKKHVENRILSKADLFIRIEIVRGVRELASQCNASELEEHCRKFEDLNKMAVDRVQMLENAASARSASMS